MQLKVNEYDHYLLTVLTRVTENSPSSLLFCLCVDLQPLSFCLGLLVLPFDSQCLSPSVSPLFCEVQSVEYLQLFTEYKVQKQNFREN